MNNPISIIVPVYNASKHIPHIVSSIICQTYTNWELILVDDGSKDNSYDVCCEYALKDSRIKVLHQENQGPSAARNNGLRHTNGDWVTFIDADDNVLDCFLQSMIELISSNNSVDIALAGYIIVERARQSTYSYKSAIYTGKDNIRSAIAETNILHRCCPWGRMFRLSKIKEFDIKFNEKLAHSEDRLFMYDYLAHAEGIGTTSCIGYIYDSTSTNSLKHKLLPLETLYLRQQLLSQSANKLVQHFELKGIETFQIAKHLFNLYLSSVQDIFMQYNTLCYSMLWGGGKLQNEFRNATLNESLYDEVKECSKWKTFENQNTNLRNAINGDFRKMNNELFLIQLKIRLHKIVFFWRKNKEVDCDLFNKAITYLNK